MNAKLKRRLLLSVVLLGSVAVITALGLIAAMQEGERKLDASYEAIKTGQSWSEGAGVGGLKGLHPATTSSQTSAQRFVASVLCSRYLLLVTSSNRVVHVSIRSWDQFDRVYKQKGVAVIYPGAPLPARKGSA